MANEIEIKLMLEAKHNPEQRLTADTLNKVTEVIRSIPTLKVTCILILKIKISTTMVLR